MPTQEQINAMKNVRDTIASGQGASLNANQPKGTVSSGYRPDPVPFAQAGNPTLQKNQTIAQSAVTPQVQPMTTSVPTPIKPLQTVQPNAPVAPAPLTAAQLEEQDRIASEGLIEGQMKETNKIASQYGLDTGPTSIQEMVDKAKNDKAQAMKYAEEQKARQDSLDLAQSGRAQKGMEGASAANTAALAQSREGAFSGSAQTVAGEYRTEIQKQIQENNTRLQAAEASRDQQMLELKNAQQSGNTELVSQIQKDLAYANQQVQKTKTDYLNAMSQQNKDSMDLLQILDKNGALAGLSPDELNFVKQGMPGVPQGIVDIMSKNATSTSASTKAAAEYEQTTKGLKTFTEILSQGGTMTPESIQAFSSSLGIPQDMALSAYNSYSKIRDDKTLDQAQKKAAVQNIGYELQQKAKGIFNEAAQNIDTLANMYKNGATPEMISAFKSAAKITDDSDPMYQADLAYKQAQTEYSKSQTAESYATLKEKEQDWLALNGESPGGYMPNKSLEGITSDFKDGKLKINCKTPYQCGAFVNRFWGLGSGTKENGGMPSSLADKTAAVKRNGVEKKQINEANFFNVVKPGMAFVTTYGGTGHTGIVTAVYKDGTYDTMEANIGDKNPNTPDPPRPGHRSWKDANLVGFARPPEGKASEMKGGKEDTAMKKYYNEALLSGLPPSAAKKIATEKTVEDLKKTEVNNDFTPIVNDAAEGIISYSQMIQGADKADIPKIKSQYSAALKEKADQETDPLVKKMIMSRAKGDADSTSEQQWNKATQGFTQLLDVKDTLDRLSASGKTGIVAGRLSALDPTDPDVSLLKGQVAGLIPTVARGTFGEVGVLTDADINNYQKVIGSQDSSPEQIKKATDNLTKTIFRNYVASLESSPKNTSNRIEQYKSIKSRLPEDIKKELGVTDTPKFNPNDISAAKTAMKTALDNGAPVNQVMLHMMQTSPEYNTAINGMLAKGKTPSQIMEYLSNKEI